MPAEAIHLSALEDSHAPMWGDPELRALLRLGAVAIDLAYFDRFALGVVRYLLKRPLATAPFGDRLHANDPAQVGKALVLRAAALRADRSTRRDGDRVLAFALGFLSHLAVDSRLHPLVNELARVRALRLGDAPARQHNEVEKFQSILFHEQRLGFDFMGDARIRAYIGVEANVLHDGGVVAAAYRDALGARHAHVPPATTMGRWSRGYRQYGQLLASPFGRRIAPAAAKAAERAELYEGFLGHYAEAVERSIAFIDAGLTLVETRDCDAFARVVPDGSIDAPPGATDRERGILPL